ncbi:hypothetical protein G3T36_02835 [Diaminobutyricibacter tongyongensis]|uniref:Polysaccharide chain length determinant N-terminal domain-containing protein n=1 Tax=Leifsonia tongyongensis TaxID=1268043 RepID=A0A6L9XU44_9MICO|nr:hypothetical protein [Diaminobutyricibacter tongyongensis]
MTLRQFFSACLRRWPIVLVGVLCTGLAAFAGLGDKGVYYTRTQIVFLAPISTAYPNALATRSEDIIDAAGAVAKSVTGPDPVTKYASPDVTLVGTGIRDGWSLVVPDTGGQWATNFPSQILNLDIVAPDRATVLQRQTTILRRVQENLDKLQSTRHVTPINEITITTAPRSTVIYHVGGSKPRMLGMTAALGIGLTAAVIVLAERFGRRRPTRSRR